MSEPEEPYEHDFDEGMATRQRLPNGGTVHYYFEVVAGRGTVTKVVFERTRGVSSRMLRQSPPAALEWFLRQYDEGQRFVLRSLARSDIADGRAADNPSELFRHALRARSNPWSQAVARYMERRPPREDRLIRLAVTASNYVDAVHARTRKPIVASAALQGRSVESVRDDVKRARAAGLLTDAPMRGVPGGELTDEAERILSKLRPA